MGRHTWIAGLVLCAGLTDRQTASGQTPLVHVLVMDQAEVPPDHSTTRAGCRHPRLSPLRSRPGLG